MSSNVLWRGASLQGSSVLQKRQSQGASGTCVDLAEILLANLNPAANLLPRSTLRGS